MIMSLEDRVLEGMLSGQSYVGLETHISFASSVKFVASCTLVPRIEFSFS